MPVPDIHIAVAWEASGPALMARITGAAGTNITQASITSITRYVFDKNDLTDIVTDDQSSSDGGSGMPVVSHVFDSLQTPTIWTTDSTGYNFRYDVPKEELPDGNKAYLFEFIFVPVTGEQFPVVFEISTVPLASR